jgi:hypothetical protein
LVGVGAVGREVKDPFGTNASDNIGDRRLVGDVDFVDSRVEPHKAPKVAPRANERVDVVAVFDQPAREDRPHEPRGAGH